MAYFSKFPKINYFNSTTRNIILKAAIVNEVFDRVDAFYPYIIKEGERPDIIAFQEYGDAFLDWVIYFSNNIVDPYFDWPLDQYDFEQYLKKKYNSDIYTLQSTVSHYEYTGVSGDTDETIAANQSYIITVDTWNKIPDNGFPGRDNPYNLFGTVLSPYYDPYTGKYQQLDGYSSVSIYDKEDRENTAKRSIRLLSNYYIKQITTEIETVFTT